MNDVFDYIKWRGDLSFDCSPFNEVDAFLLSQLSYMDLRSCFNGEERTILLKDAADIYLSGDIKERKILFFSKLGPMLKAMSRTIRFSGIRLSGYVDRICEEETEQFSAVTADIPGGTVCVAFRGTDDTLIGWKEDFNIASRNRVAAQEDALGYLSRVIQKRPGSKIYVTGHSKGGNLAVFAAAGLDNTQKKQLVRIWNFDGPGFREEFIQSDGYTGIAGKVCTIRPKNSTIGTLLCTPGKIRNINSRAKGLFAHDGFNWEVSALRFSGTGNLTDVSLAFKKAIDGTLEKMDDDDRQRFIDALFDVLMSSESSTLSGITDIGLSDAVQMAAKLIKDKRIQGFAHSVVEELARALVSEPARARLYKRKEKPYN